MRLSGGMTVAAALTFVNCAGSYAATTSGPTKLAKAAVSNKECETIDVNAVKRVSVGFIGCFVRYNDSPL
jgi:hypothetical protein